VKVFTAYIDAGSQYESEYAYKDARVPTKLDIETGKSAEPAKPSKKEVIEHVSEVTGSRKCWTCFTWMLTWFIPSFCMTWCGMRRPDIQMAWREKVAICVIIFFMCCGLLFFIIGLGILICPQVKVKAQSEVYSDRLLANGGQEPFVAAYGRYYDISELMDQHIKDFGPGNGKSSIDKFQFEQFYGYDVSRLFYKADLWTWYCPNLPAPPTSWDNLDPQVTWMNRKGVTLASAFHRGNAPAGYPQPFVESLNKYARGKIGWRREDIVKLASGSKVMFFYVRSIQSSTTMFTTFSRC
jgi:chitin synthase